MAKPVPPINDPGKLSPTKASKAATALSIAERIHASVDALRKVHGQDSIVSLAKGVVPGAAAQGVISTGSLSIDLAIGIGGIPRGRITEVFGPNSAGKTTLALHCIAEAQKSGGTCAFIDAEHALDVRYAQALGVKIDDDALLFSQPSSGEQALELVEGLARAGVMLIVVDSVAMLTPQKEVAGDFGDAQMGAHARLMSQAMRKLISAVAKGGSTLLFLNQIRMKLGVMYGCLHGETLVNFADGRSLPIRAVVNNRIEGEVWSLNETTNVIEKKPIVAWHHNGHVESATDYIHIETLSIDGHGRFGLTVTPDHQVHTEAGWLAANQVKLGTRLTSKYASSLNGTHGQFLSGVLTGDSHVGTLRKSSACLHLQDNVDPQYVSWKVGKLSAVQSFSASSYEAHGKTLLKYRSASSHELGVLSEKGCTRNPMWFFEERFSWLGFAILLMDDATFDGTQGHCRYVLSVKRWKSDARLTDLVTLLCDRGLSCSLAIGAGAISFSANASREIAENICTFVPPCMERKLPVEFRGRYEDFTLGFAPDHVTTSVEVVEVRYASTKQMRYRAKYDISVADNRNYMVGGCRNGVIVHNSPETTTGGQALPYAASVRIDVRRRAQVKDGTDAVGNVTDIKIVKNKCAPPFKECSLEIIWGRGFNREGDLISAALELGVLSLSGTWFSYGELRLGQGSHSAAAKLVAEPKLFAEIRKKCLKEMGIT